MYLFISLVGFLFPPLEQYICRGGERKYSLKTFKTFLYFLVFFITRGEQDRFVHFQNNLYLILIAFR